MQNLLTRNLSSVAILCMFALSMISCTKEGLTPSRQLGGLPTMDVQTEAPTGVYTEEPTTTTSASTTSGTVRFNVPFTRPDGPYSLTQVTQDFISVNGWAPTRMSISAGRMKTTLEKNVVGPAGGLVSWIYVPEASQYQLEFDMMFDSQFDFSAGGKIGYGFLIGEGYTGGVPGTNGNGGSARLMWYKGYGGRVYLKPYLYYRDQPGQYGNDFGITYPATGSISKGTWHKVKMLVKSNTGSNTDGRIQIIVNGTTLMDQPIRWTSNDLKRMINRVCFETFRGGADASWTSTTDGIIYFDNVKLTGV